MTSLQMLEVELRELPSRLCNRASHVEPLGYPGNFDANEDRNRKAAFAAATLQRRQIDGRDLSALGGA